MRVSGTPLPYIGTRTLSLQELDLRYSKAQVLLSAIKEKKTFESYQDGNYRRAKRTVSKTKNEIGTLGSVGGRGGVKVLGFLTGTLCITPNPISR